MVCRRFVAVAVAGLAAALGSLTSPPSAVATPMPYAAALAPAHSALVSAVPADQAVLASGPTELVLTFNEEINPRFAQLALSRSGDVVALNPATATGTVLRATLADPGPGTYRIAYRVVSADGHPISGETSFTVTGPTRTPTSTGPTPNRSYKEAIGNFKSLLASAPSHARAPEAALAIANCQIELKDPRTARKTLEDLIKAYPQSEAAAAGKDRLARLK